MVAHGFPELEEDRPPVFLDHQEDGVARVVGYRPGQDRVIANRIGEEIAVPTLERNVTLLTPEGDAVELHGRRHQLRFVLERRWLRRQLSRPR